MLKRTLVLFGLFLALQSCSDDAEGGDASGSDSTATALQGEVVAPQQNVAKEVEGITVESAEFSIPVQTVGNVKATKKGKIVAQVGGILRADYVFEGQVFKKGQKIASIYDYKFQTNLELQETAFERKYIDFLQADVISQDFYNLKPMDLLKKIQNSTDKVIVGRATSTGITEQLLNLKQSYLERNRRTLVAPADIVITSTNAENGVNVGSGSVLYEYIFDDRKVVEVSLFENECAYLKVGHKAVVKRQAVITSDQYVATVIGIGQQISQDRFRKVTLEFDADNNLVDGEQVELTLNINTGRFGIQVPNEAIVYRDQRPVVFVVEGQQALWKYVQVGERFGDFIELTGGIRAGDNIITKGHFTLAHQATVDFKQAK